MLRKRIIFDFIQFAVSTSRRSWWAKSEGTLTYLFSFKRVYGIWDETKAEENSALASFQISTKPFLNLEVNLLKRCKKSAFPHQPLSNHKKGW